MELKFHPYSEMFPLLTGAEFDSLVEDIRARGLLEPVTVLDGMILDGRNRARACETAGVRLRTRTLDAALNPVAWVWSENAIRRHLEPGQKAALRLKFDKASDEWERRQEARRRKANEKRSGSQKGRPKRERRLSEEKRRPEGHAHFQLARSADVSPATAARVIELEKKAPDLFDGVAAGTKGLGRAMKEMRSREGAKVAPLPDEKYRILYADPPWSYGNSMPDYAPEQADHYATMSMVQLRSLPVSGLCEADAVLFLWATSPILPEALDLAKAWGFAYKASFVWDKVRHNMGHYNSVRHEFLLICVRGSCQPDAAKLFDSVVSIERTEHSRKPEEFRRIIETLYTHGRRVELFGRERADGWDVYGKEAPSLS